MTGENKVYTFDMEIITETGLHIGGSKDAYEVGGLDNPVIKEPLTRKPYIPGSSLKGKLRHLVEKHFNLINGKDVCVEDKPGCPVATLFGRPANVARDKYAVSRLIVRDFFVKEGPTEPPILLEIKTENKINRQEGKAEHPRPIERVVRGVTFAGKIHLNIYTEDDPLAKDMIKCFLKSLELLEDSYLGGCGSRGYGAVRVKINKIICKTYPDGKSAEITLNDLKAEVGLQ